MLPTLHQKNNSLLTLFDEKGFFVFTVLLTLCTMKKTVSFFILLTLVDVTFLLLGLSNLLTDENGEPNQNIAKAGGVFGIVAAFNAWYIMYADMADNQNR